MKKGSFALASPPIVIHNEMKKKSTARRHHYLPQSYLAQFTDKGTKDGQFFVLEVESGRLFRTTPKNVAVELDFNRIDIEGQQPDAIENGRELGVRV